MATDQAAPGSSRGVAAPSNSPPPTPPSPPGLPKNPDLAWKWFQLHVTHRTNITNFLLVALGALAVAYAQLLKEVPVAAGVVAALAAATSLLFLSLDFVTMKKIDAAKKILSAEQSDAARLFADIFAKVGDRIITRFFYILVSAVSLMASLFAFSQCHGMQFRGGLV